MLVTRAFHQRMERLVIGFFDRPNNNRTAAPVIAEQSFSFFPFRPLFRPTVVSLLTRFQRRAPKSKRKEQSKKEQKTKKKKRPISSVRGVVAIPPTERLLAADLKA